MNEDKGSFFAAGFLQQDFLQRKELEVWKLCAITPFLVLYLLKKSRLLGLNSPGANKAKIHFSDRSFETQLIRSAVCVALSWGIQPCI